MLQIKLNMSSSSCSSGSVHVDHMLYNRRLSSVIIGRSESTVTVSAGQMIIVLLSVVGQLWIDSSAGGTPALPEKKEADFFAEHTQVCLFHNSCWTEAKGSFFVTPSLTSVTLCFTFSASE